MGHGGPEELQRLGPLGEVDGHLRILGDEDALQILGGPDGYAERVQAGHASGIVAHPYPIDGRYQAQIGLRGDGANHLAAHAPMGATHENSDRLHAKTPPVCSGFAAGGGFSCTVWGSGGMGEWGNGGVGEWESGGSAK